MIRIIGIDPGLANTGYGIIEIAGNRFIPVCHGVIQTTADMHPGERLQNIYQTLKQLIIEYGPSEAGIENIFFAKNAASAIQVAQAKGAVLLLLAQNGIVAGEYPPQAIKQAIVGKGRAEKKQVQELIKILLGMDSIPQPDHAADALAAAICHFNTMSFTKIIEQRKNV